MARVSDQTTPETTEPKTESHDPAVPEAYAAFMRTGWGERELDVPVHPIAEYGANREVHVVGHDPGPDGVAEVTVVEALPVVVGGNQSALEHGDRQLTLARHVGADPGDVDRGPEQLNRQRLTGGGCRNHTRSTTGGVRLGIQASCHERGT